MPPVSIKGRGTPTNIPGRFAIQVVELDDNDDPVVHPETRLYQETAKSLINRNQSPDIPFHLSVNPYRGCEHGCIYCFARPSHAYLDLSPGVDFETRISVKHNAPELFRKELSKPNYHCEPIALGINTDAYQPVEKETQITRQILRIALDFGQPMSIVTKGSLILRDLDILQEMAKRQLIQVAVSVTTLDNSLKRILEPRTASGSTRLNVIRQLREAGVPVIVLVAPVIPFINDHELEHIVEAVANAGAQSAEMIMLRLPHEVAPLFVEWLHTHFPDRAERVLERIKDMRGGKLYDSRFGTRMTGEGIYSELIRQRFRLVKKRHFGASPPERQGLLDCSQFCVPPAAGDQMSLW